MMDLEAAARLKKKSVALYRAELAKLPPLEAKLLDRDVDKVLAPDSVAVLRKATRDIATAVTKLTLGIPQDEFVLVEPRGKA